MAQANIPVLAEPPFETSFYQGFILYIYIMAVWSGISQSDYPGCEYEQKQMACEHVTDKSETKQ